MRSRTTGNKPKDAEQPPQADDKERARQIAGQPAQPPKRAGSARELDVEAQALMSSRQRGTDSHTRAAKLEMTGFERVIDNVFTFDADKAFEEVKVLKLPDLASRVDYGTLLEELDDACTRADAALLLVANAKVSLAEYQADMDVILGELREQATEALQRENGGKSPTIAAVEARMASHYHDEYGACKRRLAEGKEMVNYLEGLQKVAIERIRDLRQMVASSRGAG